MKKAARYTRDLLQHDSYHERALANQKYFQSLANEDSDKFNDLEEQQYVDPEHAKYEQLCRGDTEPIVSNIHVSFSWLCQVLCFKAICFN